MTARAGTHAASSQQTAREVAACRANARQALTRYEGAWDINGTGLAGALGRLLDALDGEPGTAATLLTLDPGQTATVLDALAHAAEHRRHRASLPCQPCQAHPDGLCPRHACDFHTAAGYDRLAEHIMASGLLDLGPDQVHSDAWYEADREGPEAGEYDPGPEAGGEGGMPEYRHLPDALGDDFVQDRHADLDPNADEAENEREMEGGPW